MTIVLVLVACLQWPMAAQAADDTGGTAPATWTDVATEMGGILDQAYQTFQAGDLETARDQVNDAYYGYYEAKGFEKVVMAYVSGQAATDAEYEFSLIKKLVLAGGPDADVKSHTETLKGLLLEQAAALDGDQAGAGATFVSSLVIILREGFEAILVVGAIIAYLIKSGARRRLPLVYAGAGLAVLASIAMAFAINALTTLAGAPQEIIEGVTVLVAMVMLMWVSSWIAAKADAAAWTGFIKRQVGAATAATATAGEAAASGNGTGGAGEDAPATEPDAAQAARARRSALSLASVAFLAVFREGAEVILLYQALQAQASSQRGAIWAGLGVGLVALVVVYLVIRLASIRLPLRPFFIGTSAVLAVLAFSFAGSGIKELQEGGVVSLTPVGGLGSFDLLGIYPTAETLGLQGAVLAVMAASFVVVARRARRRRTTAEPQNQPEPTPSTDQTDQPAQLMEAIT
ncbi:MAG: FTR1 family protein [Bifidobacteriaceae bacterium]|jgi:high-affinity iron transporter|nr:FTR1 family protein [Bifidobacteriaceae bacterium]